MRKENCSISFSCLMSNRLLIGEKNCSFGPKVWSAYAELTPKFVARGNILLVNEASFLGPQELSPFFILFSRSWNWLLSSSLNKRMIKTDSSLLLLLNLQVTILMTLSTKLDILEGGSYCFLPNKRLWNRYITNQRWWQKHAWYTNIHLPQLYTRSKHHANKKKTIARIRCTWRIPRSKSPSAANK